MKKVIQKGVYIAILLLVFCIFYVCIYAISFAVEDILHKEINFTATSAYNLDPNFSEEFYEEHLQEVAKSGLESFMDEKPKVHYLDAVITYMDEPVENDISNEITEVIYELEENSCPIYTEDDVYCLAAVIYQEAGSDICSDDTRYKVADVVLNRVLDDRFPNTIRDVLEERMQYGMFWSTGVCFPERSNYECEASAVQRAYDIAYDVLGGNHSDIYGNGYVFQAEFGQGTDGFWQDGIYFGR